MKGSQSPPFMFNFGGPEQTAQMLWDSASTVGPGLAARPLDEMNIYEIQSALVYARMALYEAMASGQPDDVVEMVLDQFEQIFIYYVPLDADYARKVIDHKLVIPSRRPRSYWEKLARRVLSES